MNPTELFFIQFGLTYLQMMIQTNQKMTPVQKAAVQNAITASEQVISAFQTPA